MVRSVCHVTKGHMITVEWLVVVCWNVCKGNWVGIFKQIRECFYVCACRHLADS